MSNFMDVEDFEKKKFDATAEKKIIHCFSTFDLFSRSATANVLFELNWQKSRIYEICDINSWCWREKKNTHERLQKKHEFLEVKRKKRKLWQKKPLLLLNSFCDPDLCLTTSILS